MYRDASEDASRRRPARCAAQADGILHDQHRVRTRRDRQGGGNEGECQKL